MKKWQLPFEFLCYPSAKLLLQTSQILIFRVLRVLPTAQVPDSVACAFNGAGGKLLQGKYKMVQRKISGYPLQTRLADGMERDGKEVKRLGNRERGRLGTIGVTLPVADNFGGN